MKVKQKIICLGIAVFCVATLCAQQPDLFQLHLGSENGLLSNQVGACMQDRDGFLWFGTNGGVDRYDGKSFSHFYYHAQDPNSISDNTIVALMQDRRGAIWAGTFHGGLNRYDASNGRWKRYLHNPHQAGSLSVNDIRAIFEDHEGTVWIATWGGGLLRYDSHHDCFVCYRHDPQQTDGLCSDNVVAISEDGDGTLWIATWSGLNCFAWRANKWAAFRHDKTNPNSLSHDGLTCLLFGTHDELWVGTWSGGLNRFDIKHHRWQRFQPNPDQGNHIIGNVIFAMALDNQGVLWVATQTRGINRYDIAHDRWEYIANKNAALTHYHVQCMMIDRNGMLWMGTNGKGIFRYHPSWNRWQVFYDYLEDEVLDKKTSRPISAMEDSHGNLWVSNANGLLQYNFERRQWTRHESAAICPGAPGKHPVVSLMEDRHGVIWAGVYQGIACFDARLNQWHYFRYVSGIPETIAAMVQDHHGRIWAITPTNGLNYFDPQRRRWGHFIKSAIDLGVEDDQFLGLLLDRHERLWLGTKYGIHVLDAQCKVLSHFHHNADQPNSLSDDCVIDMIQTDPDTYWIATRNGLNRFQQTNNQWRHWSVDLGLPENSVDCIQSDLQGNIWGGTGAHLFRLNPATGEVKVFDSSDGINCISFIYAARGRQGHLLFCSNTGCLRFDPLAVQGNAHMPEIVLSSLHVQGESKRVYVPAGSQFVLPYRQNAFTVEFAAIDYTWPEKNQYAYMLAGFDSDWLQNGSRNYASYTNVPPGRYTFRAIGSNNDGVWNKTGAALTIIVKPPYWRTWWFLCLAACIFAYLSYFCITFFKQHFYLLAFWKKKNYIGQYKLIRMLGSGGMATVYLAQHVMKKNTLVAIKRLREEYALDTVNQKRFKQEGAMIDQIDHPNIVKVFERGSQADNLYIVMEYLPGKTIYEQLKDMRVFSVAEWVQIMLQIADVLVKIHSRGIIHRDLKPANIMLMDHVDGLSIVKILDFGIARQQFQTTVTQLDAVVGTVQYIPPEQIFQAIFIPAGDIYSIGVISYEMLTGSHPYACDNYLETIQRILSSAPTAPDILNPAIPTAAGQLVMQLMNPDPHQRPDAQSLYAELRALRL